MPVSVQLFQFFSGSMPAIWFLSMIFMPDALYFSPSQEPDQQGNQESGHDATITREM